jgi:hypothetical protein
VRRQIYFKENEKHPKIETETKTRECSHSRNQVPFYVLDKVEIKPYAGEVDAFVLK